MTRLILVRHGETTSNVAQLLDTKLPGAGLTERGMAQATAFGVNWPSTPQALFSSKALRAKQTATQIADGVGVLPTALDGLHEVQLGDLEGLTGRAAYRQFTEIFHAWHAGDVDVQVPGGESARDVLDRMVPVLNGLRDKYLATDDAGDVVVVSHGAAIRLVARYLADVPWKFAANNHLDNTDRVELRPLPDGRWSCLRWGRFEPPFTHVSPIPDIPMG